MLANRPPSPPAEYPELARVLLEAAESSSDCFSVMNDSAHLEISAKLEGQRIENRCRMKMFESQPGKWAVFFYKTSAVPFSRDRFSYGAVSFPADRARDQDVDSWLRYLASGFDWDLTPKKLRRALSFDVPD